MPRHQRAREHNSTLYRRQYSFTCVCVCVNVYILEKMVRYRNFYLVIYRFSDPIELTSHITKMFMYIHYTSLFE
jgi:hypothetical protein